MKNYLGVKKLQAKAMNRGEYNIYRGWIIPENENPEEQGYLVRYPDGYESWSPREAFEFAYLEMGEDPSKIDISMVDAFRGKPVAQTLDNKTTVVVATLPTGFRIVEASSCVDKKNYDKEVGEELCIERINNKLWESLGFVLQWANNGICDEEKDHE